MQIRLRIRVGAMVLILDGNSEHVATVSRKQDCSELPFKVANALGLKICPNQIVLPILLHTCAPISELPSHISTKV